MAENPTTGDLFKAKVITSDEIDAAVDAILTRPDVGAYPIGGGYLLDLGAAIQAHKPALATLTDLDRPEKFRQTIGRVAILLVQPEKA